MALVGSFVTPHPAIIVPEVGGKELARAESTVQAMLDAGQRCQELQPDTIVLLSPHAPISRKQMGISLAAAYYGSFAQFRAPQVKLCADGDQEVAEGIVDAAREQGIPVKPMASPGEVMELDHGSIVPLYYLAPNLLSILNCPTIQGENLDPTSGKQKPGNSSTTLEPNTTKRQEGDTNNCGTQSPQLVILAFSSLSLEQHIDFGEIMGNVLISSPRRIVYVASSDLSHRLLLEGPYDYDPSGPEFDQAVTNSFAAGDWENLVSIDQNTVRCAGECGYRSLSVLRGVIKAAQLAGLQTQNHLLSYEGPFGVGYMVGAVAIGSV